MNKLVYLVLLFLIFSSCKKEEVETISLECTSDCFEIYGVVTNASTNTPEANRKIHIQTTTNNFPFAILDRGTVLTKADGSYVVRIAKTSISDKSNINFLLTLEDKPGYINEFNSNQYFIGNLNIDSIYTKNISVYQAANLKVIVNNASITDSMYLVGLSFSYFDGIGNNYGDNKLAPGESLNYDISVVLGKQTNLEILYGKIDSIYLNYFKDSITCSQINNNEIVIELK
jgi:hypothetical protein